jgi:hypothetical protein
MSVELDIVVERYDPPHLVDVYRRSNINDTGFIVQDSELFASNVPCFFQTMNGTKIIALAGGEKTVYDAICDIDFDESSIEPDRILFESNMYEVQSIQDSALGVLKRIYLKRVTDPQQ